jgi:hypothetical protein
MSIPFAVDGIRQKNYHLPRWIVNLTFISVTCISLTFLISLFILSPNAGFVYIMLSDTNLLLHTIIPITSIILFLFINTYHNVKFKTTFFALIPVIIYALIYLVLAIIIGEENGGWRDHYHFQQLMPWYFVFILIISITFGIANLLKLIHNRMHKRDKEITETAPIGNPDFLSQLEQGTATLYSTYNNKNVAAALSINVDGSKKSYIVIDYRNLQALEKQQTKTLDAL